MRAIGAIEAEPGDDLDAGLVQAGHRLEADIGLDVGGGTHGIDGEAHVHAFAGQALGDAGAQPLAMPVIDDGAGTGSGVARENVNGMQHMRRLAFDHGRMRHAAGREDDRIGPFAADHRHVNFTAPVDRNACQFRFACEVR